MEVSKYTQEALARLPREELRRMLANELNKDTNQIDDAFVRMLMTELQTRGADPAFVDDDAVVAACEKFRVATQTKQTSPKRWYQSWMLKVASVVLVLGVLFFSLPAVAEGKDVPEVLTWWSDSLFQLFRPGEKPNIEEYVFSTDHPGLQQIYDAVAEAGITVPIVPQKLSDEFQLTEHYFFQLQEDMSIHASFISERNKVLFVAIVHSQQSMLQHEKKAENVTVWNIAGIDHYVISNNNTWIITWIADNIECTITTDCPEEDVYRLIKSIYTSED